MMKEANKAAEEKERERKHEQEAGRTAIVTPHPKPGSSLKVSVKVVEEEEEERSVASEEDESGEESSSEGLVDKNTEADNTPTMPTFPRHSSPASPMPPPSHPWYVGPTNGLLPLATNYISGFNNARITGGIHIGNVTNSDSTRDGDTGEPTLQKASNAIADFGNVNVQYLVRHRPPDRRDALSPVK